MDAWTVLTILDTDKMNKQIKLRFISRRRRLFGISKNNQIDDFGGNPGMLHFDLIPLIAFENWSPMIKDEFWHFFKEQMVV